MKKENKKDTPLLEDKDIKINLDDDFEHVAIRRRRYPFFALLAIVLLILAVFLIFKASKERSVDALLDAESTENEIWQGAFFSKEIFDSARAASVSIIAKENICSGFVFSSDGWIATAEGIVNEYVEGQIEVALCDGRRFPVECFKQDRKNGLILMKINANGLIPVKINGASPSIGEELFTFCPVGTDIGENSLFCGRLSHGARTCIITRADGKPRALSLLQISFLLTEEGVGAPLFNANGELIGVAVSNSVSNDDRFIINYALPSEQVFDSLSTLSAKKSAK